MRTLARLASVALLTALAASACGSTNAPVASNDVFASWWSPTCKTSGGKCDDPNCSPATFVVYKTRCAPAQQIMTGCLPNDRVVDGWGCFLHASDGEVIFTQDVSATAVTYAQDGFTSCYEAGVTNGFGTTSPICTDGAGQ